MTCSGHEHLLAFIRDLAQHLGCFILGHTRAQRNFNKQVFAAFAKAVAAHAGLAVAGFKTPRDAKVRQGIEAGTAYEINIATVAAITAVGPTARHVLLAAKTHAAVTTIAGLHAHRYFVDKFHEYSLATVMVINKMPILVC